MNMLDELVIGGAEDLSGSEWDEAILITPRHAVRRRWNDEALRRHCRRAGERIYFCPAEDSIGTRDVTKEEKWVIVNAANLKGGNAGSRTQPNMVTLAVGMRAMVTWNVNTELDVANGARGIITRITLDSRETADIQGHEVRLKYPPAYVLVKLDRTKAAQLEGLEAGVVPITLISRNMTVEIKGKHVSVRRRQVPITAAYAFTDYRSQGQTIARAIVDIAKPPTGNLTPFHIYVALSRSSGRDTIRLLRGFEREMFTMHPCEFLRAEDARQEKLAKQTKEWWETVKQERDGGNIEQIDN
jgi:hypothetical protein